MYVGPPMQQGRPTAAWTARRMLVGAALGLATLTASPAAAAPVSDPAQALRAFPDQTSRIAGVRVYQTGRWTVPGENASSVGKALASLEPTWVGDLIRYPKRLGPTGREIRAWTTITDLVRAASPDAQFGIELNALQYQTAAEVERKMSEIRTRIDTDGWMMDFWTSANRRFPKVVQAAIADAHENGEWIGGNAFGLSGNPKVPAGSDFIAVQDFNFKIDLPAVRRLAKQVPVVYHLGNNPQAANSDGCEWIDDLDTAKRIAFLSHRAGQQATYDFHISYPVLFPGCERRPNRPRDPDLVYYNAIRDTPMLRTVGRLMNRFAG